MEWQVVLVRRAWLRHCVQTALILRCARRPYVPVHVHMPLPELPSPPHHCDPPLQSVPMTFPHRLGGCSVSSLILPVLSVRSAATVVSGATVVIGLVTMFPKNLHRHQGHRHVPVLMLLHSGIWRGRCQHDDATGIDPVGWPNKLNNGFDCTDFPQRARYIAYHAWRNFLAPNTPAAITYDIHVFISTTASSGRQRSVSG